MKNSKADSHSLPVLSGNILKLIGALRVKRGLSQEQLAVEAGISDEQIQKIEEGSGSESLLVYLKLSTSLETSLSAIILEVENI